MDLRHMGRNWIACSKSNMRLAGSRSSRANSLHSGNVDDGVDLRAVVVVLTYILISNSATTG